jgi:hypothetical protein
MMIVMQQKLQWTVSLIPVEKKAFALWLSEAWKLETEQKGILSAL